jgi:2-iminobutanoate/2-iminopropanoate deaminase
VVSIRQWLTDTDDTKAYTLVRSEFVKHECASMLAVIPVMVWPSIKVEIEVVAVRASATS